MPDEEEIGGRQPLSPRNPPGKPAVLADIDILQTACGSGIRGFCGSPSPSSRTGGFVTDLVHAVRFAFRARRIGAFLGSEVWAGIHLCSPAVL